jgi:hypothetical protein
MIVDVHTHTPTHQHAVPEQHRKSYGSWNNGEAVITTRSWAEYDDLTSAADLTIVFNIAVANPDADSSMPGDPSLVNQRTEAFVASNPSKRIGFMSVNPNFPDYMDEAKRAMANGLKGIKLGPNYQNFDPLSPGAKRIYAFAQKNALPILFHQGASPQQFAPLRYAHPLAMDEIAIEFPELRIVMAHLGHPFTRETVVTIRKHPNVYADISAIYVRPWTLYEGLTLATEWGVMGKILFGSDFPVTTPRTAIDSLRNVNEIVEGTRLPRVPLELIEGIIQADALGALGLSVPAKK